MKGVFVYLGLTVISVCVAQQIFSGEPQEIPIVAKVTAKAIDEMSGLVKSKQFQNTYWVQNDSGDRSRIFAINRLGEIITDGQTDYDGLEVKPARNSDWEELAYDGKNIYIMDLGNNGNKRTDLGIYLIQEPDPTKIRQVKPRSFLPVRYEDQTEFPPSKAWHFDSEASFFYKGKIFVITKHRVGRSGAPDLSANLYRLDSNHKKKTNILKKIDTVSNLGGWVTGASLSPNGKILAVLVQAPKHVVWLFDATASGNKMLSRPLRRIDLTGLKQSEGLTWDDAKTLLICNEQREIFELKL